MMKQKAGFRQHLFRQAAAAAASALFLVFLPSSEARASLADARARYLEDPAAFVMEEMEGSCFGSLFEEKDEICLGELPGEDFAVLTVKTDDEQKAWGGAFTINENTVTIVDALSGESVSFQVGNDDEYPFVITLPKELVPDEEEGRYALWPCPSQMPAASLRRASGYSEDLFASDKGLKGQQLLEKYREVPLYVLLAFIDKAWEKTGRDGSGVIFGLSSDGSFSVLVRVSAQGEVKVSAGTARSIARPQGTMLKTDPSLPGKMLLYTDDYIDYIVGAYSYAADREEMTEEIFDQP